MGKFRNIINLYSLEDYLNIVEQENPSNNKPYHNLYHIKCMTSIAHRIACSEDLRFVDTRNIMLAGLFHDFGYYSKIDAENIVRAIEAFEKYSKETDDVNKEVINNIKATQYPYVINSSELTLSQKIMRDADLLQWTKKNFIKQVIIGLSDEMGLTLEKLIEGQKKFMLNMNFHTPMGQRIYDRNIKEKLKELEDFKQSLNL